MLCHASLELILTIAGFWFHSYPSLSLVTTMSTLDMFSEMVNELVQTNGGAPPTVQQLVDAADLSVADAEEILQSLQDEGLLPPAKKPRKAKATKPPVEETPEEAACEEAAGSSSDPPLEPSKDDEDTAPLANLVPKRLRPYTASKAAVNMDQLDTFQDTQADDFEKELDKCLEETPAPAPATPLASAFAKGRLV